LQPIRWYDNIPLVSYWVLRGRCRSCPAPFSMRYFFIELLTGLCFAGLFYVEIIENVHRFPQLDASIQWGIPFGVVPFQGWVLFGYHAILVCFLLVVSFTDIEHMEIPLSITVTGTFVGLVGATLFPWPWPNLPGMVPVKQGVNPGPVIGLIPWPVWHPLPAWLQPGGNWQTGLATSVAGILAGSMILRAVRFLFGLGRGIEGLGVGDADLMMLAGSFLGWQPTVVAFFVAVVPGLFIGIAQLITKGNQEFSFGPSLALGILITFLCWRWIGPVVQPVLFDGTIMPIIAIAGSVFLLVLAFFLRIVKG
jgi:leader peptidase (prepilin peptidase)/N-methyltransferase